MHLQVYVRLSVLGVLAMKWVEGRNGGDQYYTAAVYEHRLLGDKDGGVKANLAGFKKATELARQQGADLILFPEYGIVPPLSSRSEMRKDLERVPNPKQVTVNPCEEAESFQDRPILKALSCMAKENDIIVVANMGGLETCTDEPGCPEDGVLQLNTNVAFDRNGTLLSRYYKERLYFELSMDLPREEQDPIFETEIGTFAMFICFDIFYEKMALTSRLQSVDAVLFSTMFFNSLPFFTATQWFQAWAMGNNATLLASNIQVAGHALSGSGIFRGILGPVVMTQNPDGISKLLVATLPRKGGNYPPRTQRTAIYGNDTGEVREDGTNVPAECSFKTLGTTGDIYNQFRCFNEDVSNYTLVRLRGSEGRVSACHGGMCCELAYNASSMDETFFLGVSNATNNSSGRYLWAGENCFLARCDNIGEKVCSHFPTQSETMFYQVTLTANFTTNYVYPSLVASSLKLVQREDWTFVSKYNTRTITMESGRGVNILLATFKGRAYNRDPPFIR